MKKNQFIYRIQKIPTSDQFANLTVEIRHKEDSGADIIFISWIPKPWDNDGNRWYACTSKWEHQDYSLLPLLKKMKKSNICWSSTFEEVINFLHDNNVEHGLRAKLYNKDQIEILNGFVSLSEILKRKFTRYYTPKELSISAEQQARLLEEIQESKMSNLNKLIAAAI